jgi:DNA-binding NarL/FixJ family response regulator
MKQVYDVLVIEDHTLLRETWTYMINMLGRFRVTGAAGSAADGIEKARSLKPDIVILDINLPDMNGMEATRHLCKLVPGIRVIGVTLHNQPNFARLMMRNGACGYVTKTSGTDELFLAMDEAVHGRKYICAEVKSIIADRLIQESDAPDNSLSRREMQIIRMIMKGDSSKEIGAQLMISVKTVEVHRYNILKKLKLRNAASLVQYINKHPHLILEGDL